MAGVAGSVLVGNRAFAHGLALPKSPVTINIVDVAGNLPVISSDQGRTWRRVDYPVPGLGGEGTMVVAPNGDLAGVTFRRNNFHGRDKVLTIDAYASTVDYDAYDARTTSLTGRRRWPT